MCDRRATAVSFVGGRPGAGSELQLIPAWVGDLSRSRMDSWDTDSEDSHVWDDSSEEDELEVKYNKE